MIKISKNRAFNDKIIFLTFNMNRIRNINQIFNFNNKNE